MLRLQTFPPFGGYDPRALSGTRDIRTELSERIAQLFDGLRRRTAGRPCAATGALDARTLRDIGLTRMGIPEAALAARNELPLR